MSIAGIITVYVPVSIELNLGYTPRVADCKGDFRILDLWASA